MPTLQIKFRALANEQDAETDNTGEDDFQSCLQGETQENMLKFKNRTISKT